jgi:DNA repair photolyase
VADLFREWLAEHAPLQAERVMARVRDARGGLDNDARFGHRMTGEGVFADLIAQRFRLASVRLGFGELPPLRSDLFRPPAAADDGQLALF